MDILSEAPVLRAALIRICVLLAVFLLLPGCRTAIPSASASPIALTTAPEPTPKTSADVLGLVELQSARVTNAFEAVMRLRPEFIQRRPDPRNSSGEAAPEVYLDGVRQGSPDMLRSIPVAPIQEIRYLSPTAAAALFGPYYAGGVISVRTRP